MAENRQTPDHNENDPAMFGDTISYQVAHLAHETNLLLEEYLLSLNLTLPQMRVLVVLNYFGSLSIGDISKRALIRQSTLSRVVDRMEKLKLVQRNVDSRNRRLVHVSLSKDGQDTYDKIRPKTQSLQSLLSGALTKEESSQFMKALEKLVDKLKEGRLGNK